MRVLIGAHLEKHYAVSRGAGFRAESSRSPLARIEGSVRSLPTLAKFHKLLPYTVSRPGIFSPVKILQRAVFVTDLTTRLTVTGFCCLFVLLGAALIPYAGVQNDEALFASPIYSLNPNGLQIPLMVMSYVGTLKTLLYLPIFAVAGTTVWSVRLPMVLSGALTIFIFYGLALQTAGRRTALLACALLSTDPAFLLPDTFDWGPVALHQLLLVTACLS